MEYKDKYVAFLDIIGFKSIVSKSVNDNKEIEYIKKIIKILRKVGKNKSYTITQFSDSLVISIDSKRKNALQNLINTILDISIQCFKIWYMLRGGITKGKLIHEENFLFGPAMNTAYELESEYAVYPRIILDPKIVPLSCEKRINKDFDGLYYIDFFNSNVLTKKSKNELESFIHGVRDLLKNNKRCENLSIQQKYDWLKNKYETFLTQNIQKIEKLNP